MEQPSKLLKVMGVILEIFGIIMLVTGGVNTLGRAWALATGWEVGWHDTGIEPLICVSIISIACGLLYLLCGIWGRKAKKLNAAYVMSFAILAAQIVSVIITIYILHYYNTFDSLPQHLLGIVLVILFIIGVRQTKARAILAAPETPKAEKTDQ